MEPTPDTGAAAVADSPTAPDFASFSREQDARDVERFSGPTAPAAAHADPAPEAPAAPEQADSPPADPSPGKPKKNLDSRLQQLDGENAELRERLKTRRLLREELASLERAATTPKPASDPASPPKPQEWQRYKLHPDAPKVEDFEVYEDYLDARSTFIADRRYEERQQRERLDAESSRRAQSLQDKITGFHARLQSAREADPDFESRIDPALLEVEPAFVLRPGEPVRAHNVLAQHVVWSDASMALLTHFSTPEGQQDWQRLVASETPADLMLGFGRLEARFLGGVSGPAAPAAPAKPVSTAPPPPTTVGSRASGPVDRKDHAVRNRDYSAYQAAADAEDLAVRRR